MPPPVIRSANISDEFLRRCSRLDIFWGRQEVDGYSFFALLSGCLTLEPTKLKLSTFDSELLSAQHLIILISEIISDRHSADLVRERKAAQTDDRN
jgi:hypothetical protein